MDDSILLITQDIKESSPTNEMMAHTVLLEKEIQKETCGKQTLLVV